MLCPMPCGQRRRAGRSILRLIRRKSGLTCGGESLEAEEEGRRGKGWALVLAGGYPLGWGEAGRRMLKNHYPKGLRVSI